MKRLILRIKLMSAFITIITIPLAYIDYRNPSIRTITILGRTITISTGGKTIDQNPPAASINLNLKSSDKYVAVGELNEISLRENFANIVKSPDNLSSDQRLVIEAEELKQVSFVCDSRSEKPTMLARTAKGDIPIIVWDFNGFSDKGYIPSTRCKNVSERFENARQKNSFNYITYGKLNGSNVICTVKSKNEQCTEDGLLFTLHEEKDVEYILIELVKARLEIKYGCLSRGASGSCSGLLFTAIRQ